MKSRWDKLRSPEEIADAQRVRAERVEMRAAELATLRALFPAAETKDDPPVIWRKSSRISAEPNGLLLEMPRLSGRGLPGSRLVVAARSYDGAGPNGGLPSEYAALFVVHHGSSGYLHRSMGVVVRQHELRAVAQALSDYADALDAAATSEP